MKSEEVSQGPFENQLYLATWFQNIALMYGRNILNFADAHEFLRVFL